jgi:hypothetical protein
MTIPGADVVQSNIGGEGRSCSALQSKDATLPTTRIASTLVVAGDGNAALCAAIAARRAGASVLVLEAAEKLLSRRQCTPHPQPAPCVVPSGPIRNPDTFLVALRAPELRTGPPVLRAAAVPSGYSGSQLPGAL